MLERTFSGRLMVYFLDITLSTAVIVTVTRWDEAPRFRHQVTRQLVRFFNVVYVVIDLDNLEDRIEKINDRFIIYTPGIGKSSLKRIYWVEAVTHHLINRIIRNKIINFLKNIKSKKMLINFQFDFYQLVNLKGFFVLKCYICNDEFPKMLSGFSRYKIKAWFQERLFNYYERQVIKHSDFCLAPHTPLVQKIQKINKNVQLFLPGHEFRLPARPSPLRQRTRPIRIGYMGFITYYLLTDWLLEIARSNDFELFMLGPIEKYDPSLLKEFSNVKFMPALKGKELEKNLTKMDVLIIPYDTQKPTVKVQTAPNKFYQYLAAGKPVVISNMPHFIEMPEGLLYKAKSAKEFVQKIRQAFSEDTLEKVNLRLKIASENSWDKRGEQLYEIINKLSIKPEGSEDR